MARAAVLAPLLLACAAAAAAWLPTHPSPPHATPPLAPTRRPLACALPPRHRREEKRASALLLALDVWLRRQPVRAVLSRAEAGRLLDELRADRRFWAQQRRQFARMWDALVDGLSQEPRPLALVLGAETCERLLNALEQMDEQPAAVNAVLRSEVVEKMLGHVLYEGIFEFIQRADFLGNLVNGLPIIGPLRVQLIKAGRERLTLILGDQLMKFLGEYSASAAESAVQFVMKEESVPYFRRARRQLGEKLLKTPIANLVALNPLEMAILRDSIWTAVQDFRLPNEESLLDALYDEFGDEPFAILLPTQSQADRGDAPFYEAARDVLQGTLTQFLASEDWRQWSMDDAHTAPPDGGVEESKSNQGGSASTLKGSSLAKRGKDTRTDPIEDLLDGAGPGSAASWDGWD